jgi:hypothetical protein
VSYTYDLNPTHGLVIIRNASSKWTGTDVLEGAEEIVAVDAFAPNFDWVYDLRFIHSTVITVVEMEQIVERFRLYQNDGIVGPKSRSVVVGADEDLRYTGALYQKKADCSDARFTIVETVEEARTWLGIEEPAAEIGLAQ